MNFIDKEIKEIESATDKAMQLVDSGKFTQALRQIDRFKKSFCCSESIRAQTLIEALILCRRRKKAQARALICARNYVAWGSDELKAIFRMTCPATTLESKLFCLSISGGHARLGLFSSFGEQDCADFEVIANSKEEALDYIKQFGNYAVPESLRIIKISVDPSPAVYESRGILSNSPFYQKLDFNLDSEANSGSEGKQNLISQGI